MSHRYNLTPEAIAAANQISLQSQLQPGQVLSLPLGAPLPTPHSDPLRPAFATPSEPVVSDPNQPDSEQQQALEELHQQREQLRSYIEEWRSEASQSQSLTARETLAFQLNKSKDSASGVTSLSRPVLIASPIPAAASGTLIATQVPATSPVAASKASVYLVRPGDTLSAIAQRYGMSREELARANRISNPNLIKVGQQLHIPQLQAVNNPETAISSVFGGELPQPYLASQGAIDHTASDRLKADVQRLQDEYQGNSLLEVANLAQSAATKKEQVEHYNSEFPLNAQWRRRQEIFTSSTASNRQPRVTAEPPLTKVPATTAAAPIDPASFSRLQPGIGDLVSPELPPLSSPEQYLPGNPQPFTGYIWPAKGVLTSGYGRRWGRMHKGIDIAAPIGTPIVAAATGEVVTAGWNSGGYGNLVKLKHPDGSVTLYAHNSRILVKRGQKVNQGELVAEMGSTGYSTGPHLHFEIHLTGQGATNPMAFLPKDR
ncbi:MAG: peptidoglycan DD-metalloendopeptidase family protein [Chloroflexaceae bacterium]|nr:peptidoglycan DD-metalloendopeptidase family protein [Chloroflexaceae bacterium]